MSASAKTRLAWSLAILLVLATIATSVSYVVSAHLAQAQSEERSPGLKQIALITGPGIPPVGLWAFDISYVDDQSQVYYLADASNASVDLVDTRNNRLIGQIGGFRGFHGIRSLSTSSSPKAGGALSSMQKCDVRCVCPHAQN